MGSFRSRLVIAVMVAMLIVPATASAALLTNEYGLMFAGRDACFGCHDTTYNATTHGEFAHVGADPADPNMWPAGKIGVGITLNASDIAFSLGGGTGLKEYVGWGASIPSYAGSSTLAASGPFAMLEGLETKPGLTFWEYGATGIDAVSYTCSQCHQLGVVRQGKTPLAGHGTGAGTSNTWAKDPALSGSAMSDWIAGSSIQCENCHGTGLNGTSTVDAGPQHYGSGVKIVGFNIPSDFPYARADSRRILDSEVCGQCHGSYKSGAVFGYTPDVQLVKTPTNPNAFVTPYTFADIPTAAAFESSAGVRANSKFYPSGHNSGFIKPNGSPAGLKHSYYTEWTLSAHSWRGQLTSTSPNASVYQQTGAGHYSTTLGSVGCTNCHTGEGYLKSKNTILTFSFTQTTATTGFYGQECAVCHIAHQPDGSGLALRQPDAAGVRSAVGQPANLSMCEDCHNWQAEVLGTAITPATSGRGPSHPQREVLHGRAFFDVPAAPMFMPNAKCEFCHMPATKADVPSTEVSDERYGDRSLKRFSHRMLIMMPGDAKKWGLDGSGDSCSPCHAGETQDMLQANIDTWQAQSDAEAANAVAAIAAAKLRTEYGVTAGSDLVGRAYSNEKMFENDSSHGVHNPPYVLAALKKSTSMAKSVGGSFGPMFSSASIATGGMGSVAGKMLFGDGTAAAGADLTLESFNGTAWVAAGMTAADASGNYAFTVSPSATTMYRVRWDRSSNPASDLYSSTRTIVVVGATPPPGPLTPTSITINTSATSVRLGSTFILSGVVTPTVPNGEHVVVYFKRSLTDYWHYSSARLVYGTSQWWYRYKPLVRGTRYFKAVFVPDTDDGFAGSESGVVSVTTR